jgi:hypothetical protein
MKMIRFAAFAVAIATAATLIGSAGAATGTSAPKIDLSTDQAVVSYLTSLGIDPAGVVIQRGVLNYAGPSCPGTGWTCTTATKVVQVAQPGGQNQVACGAGANVIPDSYLTSTLTQDQINQLVTSSSLALPVSTCVAVQAGGAQTNTFRCVRRESPEPVAIQECEVDQPQLGDNLNASNRAFVLEMIDQNTLSNQDGTQRSKILQAAVGSAQNFAHVIQYTKQSTKIDSTQTQEGSQLSCVGQFSETGSEFSQTIQSLAQKELSSSAAPNQNQNATPASPISQACDAGSGNGLFLTSTANTFARTEQDSNSGALESHVNQSHNLDARAPNATAGSQTQGDPGGGIQGKIFQNSPGTAKSFGLQNEDQSLAGNSPTITQRQFGPLTCCSTQFDNPHDNVKIDQTSSQSAVSSPLLPGDLSTAIPNPNAYQQTTLEGNFETTGDGQITHKAKQNEGSATASCPPDGVSFGEGGEMICSLTTFGVNGAFPPID